MNEYETVGDFIKEFRQKIGDTTCEVPVQNIITWINIALRRLARSKGLDKLFTYHDTFELARLDADGTPSASWKLKGLETDSVKLGMVIDIKSILVLDMTGCCIPNCQPCYMPMEWFRREHPFPEREAAGYPCAFTLNQIKGTTQIIFDRPIPKPMLLDLIYSAFPPRITSTEEPLRVPYAYADILLEGVTILFNQESQDYAFALSNTQEWDFYVAEAREMLAHQHSGLPMRTMRASY